MEKFLLITSKYKREIKLGYFCSQYLQRVYLYNQPEWTCKLTGKTGLTFAEAVASEEKTRKSLDAFPEIWKGPLLAFVQHSQSSIEQISMLFMDFVRTNCIPGEEIRINFDGRL